MKINGSYNCIAKMLISTLERVVLCLTKKNPLRALNVAQQSQEAPLQGPPASRPADGSARLRQVETLLL